MGHSITSSTSTTSTTSQVHFEIFPELVPDEKPTNEMAEVSKIINRLMAITVGGCYITGTIVAVVFILAIVKVFSYFF